MVGGTIIDIVKVRDDKWWVNCVETFTRRVPEQCAIYVNPLHERLDVGDGFWWHGDFAYWTPRDRSRVDVKLPRIGLSGVVHPDVSRCAPVERTE